MCCPVLPVCYTCFARMLFEEVLLKFSPVKLVNAWPTSTSMRKMLDVLGSLLAKIQVMNFACGLEFLVLISISHPSLSQSHFVALDPEVSIQRRTQMCLGKRGEEGRKNQRLSVYRLDLSFVIFWKWWKAFAEVLMDILQVTNYCTLLKYSASSHCLGQPCDFYVPATSQLPLSCSGDSPVQSAKMS